MAITIDVASDSALLSVAEKLERQNEILSGGTMTIKGDNAYICYSANADGADFTEEWSNNQRYVGFSTAQSMPTNKEDFVWVPFVGENGTTPHIGDNGNWYIGSTDTGVRAEALAEGATVVQTTGNNTGVVMSQKAVTDKFDEIAEAHCGKNLLALVDFEYGKRFTDEGEIVDDGEYAICGFLPIRVGDTVASSYVNESGSFVGYTLRRVLTYDADKNFVALLTTNDTYFTVKDEKVKYVRAQFSLVDGALRNLPMLEYAGSRTNYEEPRRIDILSPEKIIHGAYDFKDGNEEFIFSTNQYTSDLTIIGDFLVAFSESDTSSTGYGTIFIYRFDLVTNKLKNVKQLRHNFGHMNTVDYNEEADCLIFGNGSGNYSLAGKFYIIPNAKSLLSLDTKSTVELSDWAIEFDGSTAECGAKWNVCWAHRNNGRNDMAMLITNDNKDIRLLQIGKGTNVFTYGNMLSGKGDDEYNGTFNIIGHCVIDDGRTSEYNGSSVNQGSDWYKGKLYTGVGHNATKYWIIEPNFSKGTAQYTEISTPEYGEAGESLADTVEGICVTEKYIILKVYDNVGVNKIVFRRHS